MHPVIVRKQGRSSRYVCEMCKSRLGVQTSPDFGKRIGILNHLIVLVTCLKSLLCNEVAHVRDVPAPKDFVSGCPLAAFASKKGVNILCIFQSKHIQISQIVIANNFLI